ncbi:hypothetical protein M419DRAFT_123915 [Trichoderma reesei RUT C-30]|nr:hypothetical protein M419DRAFT_123915 [Trichoderma reesei RUT C-30]
MMQIRIFPLFRLLWVSANVSRLNYANANPGNKKEIHRKEKVTRREEECSLSKNK